MRVIALSPYPQRIAQTFALAGDEMIPADDLTADARADFIVVYGHRKMITAPVLRVFEGRIINIHISMLPFNRGADPNFWACFDRTPSGVSIHHIDTGMDTGDLLGQRSVFFHESDTLWTSHNILRYDAEAMFRDLWQSLRRDACRSWKQPPGGTTHKSADKDRYFQLLKRGWATPLHEAVEIFARAKASEGAEAEREMSKSFIDRYDTDILEMRNDARKL